MKFTIITHVLHIEKDNQFFGYAPYIREMDIWLQFVDEVQIVAPIVDDELSSIHASYKHQNINFLRVASFNMLSIRSIIYSLIRIPKIMILLFKVMRESDHIHLRCPGNMGLLACIVQIAFPKKNKTAKYAGNWDPQSKQPWSYRFQKWILNTPFLTKNIKVLVYGEWEGSTQNIVPFFTATYSESEMHKETCKIRSLADAQGIKFLFVGTLSKGKQPLYAVQLVEKLHQQGNKVQFDLYGEGVLREELEAYIANHNLKSVVVLKGNESKENIIKAYQQSHFLILPSKSEGWPKVVAEAMFWGCIPMVTPVSCVPYMLGNGSRGLILSENSERDTMMLETFIKDNQTYSKMSQNAMNWSRQFTTDEFEKAIKQIVLGTPVA